MEEVPLLLTLLLFSAFFSAAEIALFSLGNEKIQALKNKSKKSKEKKKIARLEELKRDGDKLLVTILIGNNIVNIAASSIATLLALDIAQNYGLAQNENIIIGGVTGVMTFLILFFGEITPKALAHKYALPYALFAAPILKGMEYVFWPIIIPITKMTQKFMGIRKPQLGLSEDELKAALELSAADKHINPEEKELVEKILEFDDHSVETIMTPRRNVFALPDNMSIREALPLIHENKYSRIPIYHEVIDNIIGVLKVQTLVSEYLKEDFLDKNLVNLSLIKTLKVPLTMHINNLLVDMQKSKLHMAFVYNEHGGLIGLITLEDIIEEIFGEFEDEEDEYIRQIKRIGAGVFECQSDIELEHIESFVKKSLGKKSPQKHWPWPTEAENKTLAYFLLERFEHFPEVGESISLKEDGYVFEFLIITKDREEKLDLVKLSIKEHPL